VQGRFVDVALRLALPGPLQFSVPEALLGRLVPGQRVLVPLRAGRDVGYVVGFSGEPKVSGVRPVQRALDEVPQLPPDLFALVSWIAARYLAPIGLALRAAVPQAVQYEGLRRAAARERLVQVASLLLPVAEAGGLAAQLARSAPAQSRALVSLAAAPSGRLPAAVLNRGALEGLARRGVVGIAPAPMVRGVLAPPGEILPPVEPSHAQAAAFQRIGAALAGETARPFLVHGVTGSGKTELYLRAVRELPSDRQALLLVPEISLTGQLISHLRRRLPFPVAVWHHQLSDGEKYDLWRAARRGEVRLVVGTRSAVFAPLPRLGLVIVDEEHETSYKQEETPCYHAREAALERARLAGAPVLVGSATPSLESRRRAAEGAYELLALPERHSGIPLPVVELLDLRLHRAPAPVSGAPRPRGAPEEPRLIAPPLLDAAGEALAAGDQVLFFLNRRGFAPFTQCRRCGEGLRCPNCRVSLVFHAPEREHRCHYCGYRVPAPETCPSCGAPALRLAGSGTQRLEQEIRRAFPGREVLRLDRDTASRKGAGPAVIADFEAGRADVLVGTQLVAKGLHFPRLTLVGVLGPDLLLNLPDFRAAERAFSIVSQVAGRAGRGDRPGRVIVQTLQPEHYALRAAAAHDYESFYAEESAFREELGYPPFADLVALRLDGADRDRLAAAAESIAGRVRACLAAETAAGRCRVLGPVPAPLERIRNRWRSQIIVKARPLEAAAGPLRAETRRLQEAARRAGVHLLLDVDPVSLM